MSKDRTELLMQKIREQKDNPDILWDPNLIKHEIYPYLQSCLKKTGQWNEYTIARGGNCMKEFIDMIKGILESPHDCPEEPKILVFTPHHVKIYYIDTYPEISMRLDNYDYEIKWDFVDPDTPPYPQWFVDKNRRKISMDEIRSHATLCKIRIEGSFEQEEDSWFDDSDRDDSDRDDSDDVKQNIFPRRSKGMPYGAPEHSYALLVVPVNKKSYIIKYYMKRDDSLYGWFYILFKGREREGRAQI